MIDNWDGIKVAQYEHDEFFFYFAKGISARFPDAIENVMVVP